MSSTMVLSINIENHQNLPLMDISDIYPAQGDLKSLSKDDYRALRYGLEDYGYCSPLIVWKDSSGVVFCADGHQRLLVLKAMRDDGWFIPKLPVIELLAEDKANMLKKLTLLASSYGKATDESVSDFAISNDIDWEFIEKYTALSDFKTVDQNAVEDESESKSKAQTLCPACGHLF